MAWNGAGTAAPGGGITQADPAAMQQAYQTYDATVRASQEAYNRVNAEEEALMRTWGGRSAQTFDTAVKAWLEKFTVVITNLAKMREALGGTRGAYTRGEDTNTQYGNTLVTTAGNANIPNLL